MVPPKKKTNKKGVRRTTRSRVVLPAIPASDPAVVWDPNNGKGTRDHGVDELARVSVFDENGGGVPPFTAAAESIYLYVDSKAREIGVEIPRNRGVPATAVNSSENMLSVQEKAILIHGRAIGIPYRIVVERLNQIRAEQGIVPLTRDPDSLFQSVAKYKDLITAIQKDLLAAVEEWSPLVIGQHRFVWHARLVQFYAEVIRRLSEEPYDAIRRIDNHGDVVWLNKVDEIRRLDKAMHAHMAYFDKLGMGDMKKFLQSPSQAFEEQEKLKGELEIEEAYEKGEISEVERLKRLRELKHGAAE